MVVMLFLRFIQVRIAKSLDKLMEILRMLLMMVLLIYYNWIKIFLKEIMNFLESPHISNKFAFDSII